MSSTFPVPSEASEAVAFEPFHGYPPGLRIHVKDLARLNSLGQEVLGGSASTELVDIDAIAALQSDARSD